MSPKGTMVGCAQSDELPVRIHELCACPHRPSLGTCVNIGTIQRRLAWPLRKDDKFPRDKAKSVFAFCAAATGKNNPNPNRLG